MVVEYIRYTVPAEQADAFEECYRRARATLAADQRCLAWEVSRCVEHPERYVVRIEWDSVEGHLQGFRKSAGFAEFFDAVKPFFEAIDEMTHYQPTANAERRAGCQ